MGCLTIVNAIPGVDRDEWEEAVGPAFHYGIAYGESDAETKYAADTRHKIREQLQNTQAEHDFSVVRWVEALYVSQGHLWPAE